MSLARVKAWYKHFREGRVSLADDAWSKTPHHITDDIVQLVNGLVTQDHQVTVKAVAAEVGLSIRSVHTIMAERLNWCKVCAQWVLHNRKHVEWPTVLIICSAMPGKGMSFWHEWWLEMSFGIITSNQKRNDKVSSGSIQGHHHQKSKAIHTSAGKVMLTFFDRDSPLLIDFLQRRKQ